MKKTGLSLLLLVVLATANAAPDNCAAWWQNAPLIFKPSVQPPHEPVTMRPKEIGLCKDLPHNNGRRGTWSAMV